MSDFTATQAGLDQLHQTLGREVHAGIEANLRIAALEAENARAKDLLRQLHEAYGPPPDAEASAETAGPPEQDGPVSLPRRKRHKWSPEGPVLISDEPAAGG